MILQCKKLSENNDKVEFLKEDENFRSIFHYAFHDVMCVGENLLYPNLRLYSLSLKEAFNPYEERIMSLQGYQRKDKIHLSEQYENIMEESVFFFAYNTDNYYHFLYDSLPHIHSYLHLKKTNPNLKLLMTSPNSSKETHYNFVIETLGLLGIESKDISNIKKNVLYKKVYVSSSYTHGIDSNLAPRKEVYELLQSIPCEKTKNLPVKIYVSRRSWLHGDYSNIGTDYTSRRRMLNEDVLVQKLENMGIVEIFTEKLNTHEKIQLFRNAQTVVGSIGGGMANCLFSQPSTKTIVIVSPTFLEINGRFKYCFSNVDVKYAMNNFHIENHRFKKYMRVTTPDGEIGEIESIDLKNGTVVVCFSNFGVAGWNKISKYEKRTIFENQLTPVDNGLNSEWVADIDEVMEILK